MGWLASARYLWAGKTAAVRLRGECGDSVDWVGRCGTQGCFMSHLPVDCKFENLAAVPAGFCYKRYGQGDGMGRPGLGR